MLSRPWEPLPGAEPVARSGWVEMWRGRPGLCILSALHQHDARSLSRRTGVLDRPISLLARRRSSQPWPYRPPVHAGRRRPSPVGQRNRYAAWGDLRPQAQIGRTSSSGDNKRFLRCNLGCCGTARLSQNVFHVLLQSCPRAPRPEDLQVAPISGPPGGPTTHTPKGEPRLSWFTFWRG